jgi:polyphosphate kinase
LPPNLNRSPSRPPKPQPVAASARAAVAESACARRTRRLPCPGLDDSSLYIHRELSQLQFNIRVLEQALDESYPLLERLKFLLIFSSNLDEFFRDPGRGPEEANHLRPRAGRCGRFAAASGAGSHQ